MIQSVRGAWKRYTALALAGALAVAGLWLAVGAGAKDGGSVRQHGYPVTYHYETKITNVKYGKVASTHSKKVRFTFRVKPDPGYNLQYIKTKCKLDGRRYKSCDSPKRYRHLDKGKHRFKVKAVYDGCGSGSGCDASKPDKHVWKVK
jgi:hypothetical protein